MTRTVLVAAGVALVVALITVGAVRLLGPDDPPTAEPQTVALDRQEVGQIVRDYLLENPGLLEEVIDALEQEQFEAQAHAQRQAIADNRETIFNPDHAFVAGNPDGDITLVEFFDYNCPYCRQMVPILMELIDSDPELRLVLWDWPVLGQQSVEAARVALAVKRLAPESFLEFHRALADQRGQVDGDRAAAIAEEIGIDGDDLAEAMTSEEIDTALSESVRLGQQLRLQGTPSYIVGDEVLGGAVGPDRLRERIAQTRESG